MKTDNAQINQRVVPLNCFFLWSAVKVGLCFCVSAASLIAATSPDIKKLSLTVNN